MILLYDTNPERANKSAEGAPDRVLVWEKNAWRNSSRDKKEPRKSEPLWLLIHDSDIGTPSFKNAILKSPCFPEITPIIHFTGGNPGGKPEGEIWVRYRLISETDPFTKIELEALDNWVGAGCNLEKAPWLLLEEKPHHLRGLLILLKAANAIHSEAHNIELEDKNSFDVKSASWWKEKLAKEENWELKLRNELSHRTSSSDDLKILDNFIDWVNGKISDKNKSDKARGHLSPKSEPPWTKLFTLLRGKL